MVVKSSGSRQIRKSGSATSYLSNLLSLCTFLIEPFSPVLASRTNFCSIDLIVVMKDKMYVEYQGRAHGACDDYCLLN